MANQVASSLSMKGAWNIVCGKEKKPDAKDEKQVAHWENLNDKALALIGLALSNNIIHHLDFDDIAHEMWFKLEHLFSIKIMNSTVFLQQESFKLNMKHQTLSIPI